MSKTRLSLCMIVRDEAAMLPDFLSSVEGLWDELVVVDTGSTDATVALLEQAGATVTHRPWGDDFSAARNAGLELASGEWIAFFDADERVSPELRAQLRGLVDDHDSDVGAATVVMQNQHASGHTHSAPLLRVFRSDPEIRFVHRIHEDISTSVSGYLSRTGRRLESLSGRVDHLGYVREVASAKDKRVRDVRLLERCLADDPDDLYSHYKRMEQARYWHDNALWRVAARDASTALNRCDASVIAGAHFGGEFVVLTALGLYPGDAKGALVWLEGWEERIVPSAAFYYWRGHQREVLGQFESALKDYQSALGHPGTRNLQLSTVRPLMGLCRIALATGQLPEARTLVLEALSHQVVDDEIEVAARAMADLAMADGDAEDAVALMRPLAGDPPSGADGITFARALMMHGDIHATRAIVAYMVLSLPEAGIGLVMCDLCLGQDSNVTLDLSQHDADLAMKAWVDVVLRSKDIEISRGFLRNAGAITDVFPWLQPYVFELLGVEAED
jgi:glycosyltransferase involved in cell wall biosynthesis